MNIKNEDLIFESDLEEIRTRVKEKLEQTLRDEGFELYVSLAEHSLSTLMRIQDSRDNERHNMLLSYGDFNGTPDYIDWQGDFEILQEAVEIVKGVIKQYEHSFATIKEFWEDPIRVVKNTSVRGLLNQIGFYLSETIPKTCQIFLNKNGSDKKIVVDYEREDCNVKVKDIRTEGVTIDKEMVKVFNEILKG